MDDFDRHFNDVSKQVKTTFWVTFAFMGVIGVTVLTGLVFGVIWLVKHV